MKHRLVLRARVLGDVERAGRHYESQREGLGADFVASIEHAIASIQSGPLRYPEVHRGVRRILAQRFPYAVFFTLDDRTVVVLAVLHQATDPARWPR